MATIRPVKNGFRVEVYVEGARASKVLRTKREASAWGAAKEVELRQEKRALPDTRYTLGNAIDRYLEEVVPRQQGAVQAARRLKQLKRMTSADSLLCDLPAPYFAEFRNLRLTQVKPATVRRELTLLKSVYEQARTEWLWISDNPLSEIKKPGHSPHRERTLSRAEIKGMLKEMKYSPTGPVKTESQAAALALLLALRTGMRAGELCGMTWDVVSPKSVFLAKTKTKPRDVPFSWKARRLLEKAKGRHERMVLGLTQNTLSPMFVTYRKRAGLAGFTFHDTRHTAATWMAKKVDVLTLCKIFGWSNPKMAMTYYNPKAADIADLL